VHASDGVGGEVANPLLLLRLEPHAEQAGEERIGLLCLLAERAGERDTQLQADASLVIGDAEAEPVSEQIAHGRVGDRFGVGHRVAGEEAHALCEALP
jgi:hypothetical protein